MTPSQSKMKTSTVSRRLDWGSVSLWTDAWRVTVLVLKVRLWGRRGEEVGCWKNAVVGAGRERTGAAALKDVNVNADT